MDKLARRVLNSVTTSIGETWGNLTGINNQVRPSLMLTLLALTVCLGCIGWFRGEEREEDVTDYTPSAPPMTITRSKTRRRKKKAPAPPKPPPPNCLSSTSALLPPPSSLTALCPTPSSSNAVAPPTSPSLHTLL